MKKVTALLLMYAIIVIASSVFWLWFALSKSSLNAGNYRGNVNHIAKPDKMKQDAKKVTDQATEPISGVTEVVTTDRQANDNVKSNDI